MLSAEERDRITRLFLAFVEAKESGPLDAARLILSLPASPEALEMVTQLAKSHPPSVQSSLRTAIGQVRSLAGMDRFSSEELESLLSSTADYPTKVEALISCVRGRNAIAVIPVRKQIKVERNPFVLATMACLLGHLGVVGDGVLLLPLLRHPDARVIANALESLHRLQADVPPSLLTELTEASDLRIRINSLALLARSNPDKVLDIVPTFVQSSDITVRGGIACLLGELAGRQKAVDLLLDLASREEKASILKQIATALKKHALPRNAPQIIGPLYDLKLRADGAKSELFNVLLHEIGIECGLVETQVREIGRAYVEQHRAIGDRPLQAEDADPLDRHEERARSAESTGEIAQLQQPSGASSAPDGSSDSSDRSIPPFTNPMLSRTSLPSSTMPTSRGISRGISAFSRCDSVHPSLDDPLPQTVSRQEGSDSFAMEDVEEPLSLSAIWSVKPLVPPGQGGASNGVSLGLRNTEAPFGDWHDARWKWTLTGLAFLMIGLWLFRSSATSISPTGRSTLASNSVVQVRSSSKNSFRIQTRSSAQSLQAPSSRPSIDDDDLRYARHLGPVGAEVDLDGEVVTSGAGRVIVQCLQRYYVVKGRRLDSQPPGTRVRLHGTMAGVSGTGLVYVQVEAR